MLVIHRKRYRDWTLPKGKLKDGERFIAAALREVKEETGCVPRIDKYLGAIGCEVNNIPKAVVGIHEKRVCDAPCFAKWLSTSSSSNRRKLTAE